MFGNKKTKKEVVPVVKKVNAADLDGEVNSIIEKFTKTIDNLRKKSQEANALKETKEAEIKALQTECSDLEAVSTRATTIADKISNIFN